MQERHQTKAEAVTPAVREISFTADNLLRALLSLHADQRLSVLDSCIARDSPERFLIAGFNPCEIIEARGNQISITRRVEEGERVIHADALAVLDERLAEYSSPRLRAEQTPVAGACIATFSYELVHQLERLRLNSARHLSDEPDMVLAFYDTLVIHDYRSETTKLVSLGGPKRLDQAFETLNDVFKHTRKDYEQNPVSILSTASNLTRDEYLAAVRRIKEHIAAGDIYQANLTQQFSCAIPPETTPENIFWRLRRDHPAPFAAFIRRRDDVVISASPERFLRVVAKDDERYVEAWPIKGTRARGATMEEDAALRAELLASEKDRAENIMIVDLLRNDLGRVSRYGSIEVTELCALEEHPTLFHLVSKVRGTLRDEVTVGALLRAAFPCGSITGAPKIRAMEIINDVETKARGLSMGAIGYFSFDGSLDLSVAIRTMTVRDSVARFNVGGGIVADSCPALEYEESLLKARALLHALGGNEKQNSEARSQNSEERKEERIC
jgi:para-aminobenzoate synthetase component 1